MSEIAYVMAVAQVKHEMDGRWWEFNDECVNLIGDIPTTSDEPVNGATVAG